MADDLDILTLDEAKTAINMKWSNADHDAELAQDITAISRIFDAECGPVVQRTVSAELHSGDLPVVTTRLSPVAGIGTVRESQAGDITTLSASNFGGTISGYLAEPYWQGGGTLLSGVLQRRYLGITGEWPAGCEVEVTYTAGRYPTTETVDARFKACAAAVLQRFWKGEAGVWAQSAATIYEDATEAVATPALSTVAKQLINEMLWDEKRMPGIA